MDARSLWPSRVLVVVASVLLLLSILATWIRAQVIDTSGWTSTSVRLLQDAEIREAVADEISERLLSAIGPEGLVRAHLPSALAPLAGVVGDTAATALPKAIDRALEAPAIQELWGEANRRTHAQVIALLDGGGRTLASEGGVVSIDIRELLNRVGARIGLGAHVAAQLPGEARRLVLFRSNQLRKAQNGVKGLRDLGVVLPVLAIVLYLLALALAGGARSRAAVEIGMGIAVASLGALLLRHWTESYVTDNVSYTGAPRPAVGRVVAIATDAWRERAIELLIVGGAIALAGVIARAARPLLARDRHAGGR